MRVPLREVEARREKLASLLERNGYLPVSEVCRRLKISEATARRDLAALSNQHKITRTYGGALVDFNRRFPSFQQRKQHAGRAKAQIARTAVDQIQPNSTCFMDSGTTVHALAERLQRKPILPLRIVTCSLPIAETLSSIDGLEVYLLGGQLFKRQSILLGKMSLDGAQSWDFDLSFMSAEGMNQQGLWNSQQQVVELQLLVIQRSKSVYFCLDASKLDQRGPHFLTGWSPEIQLLTNASPSQLKLTGIPS